MLIKVQERAFELPGLPHPEQWSGPFAFALLADPQVGQLPGLIAGKNILWRCSLITG